MEFPLLTVARFFRQLRYQEFDVSELSLSSYVLTLNKPNPPFIASKNLLPFYQAGTKSNIIESSGVSFTNVQTPVYIRE